MLACFGFRVCVYIVNCWSGVLRPQPKKEAIVDLLAGLFRKTQGKKLYVSQVAEAELKDLTITKDQAATQTRDDVMKRKRQMVAEQHDSDSEVWIASPVVLCSHCILVTPC